MNCFLDKLSEFLIQNEFAHQSGDAVIQMNFGGKAICSLMSTFLCLAIYIVSAIIFRICSTTYKYELE